MNVTDDVKLYVQGVKEEIMKEVYEDRTNIRINSNDITEVKGALKRILSILEQKNNAMIANLIATVLLLIGFIWQAIN